MNGFKRITLARSTALLSMLVLVGLARAEPFPQITIEQTLRKAALGDKVALVVRDPLRQKTLVSINGHAPLNPASNMKLVTATAALVLLGANFSFETELYGELDAQGNVPVLVFSGKGDPTLTDTNLRDFALSLASKGVKHVAQVEVDNAYFDDQILPPGFDQQPSEFAPFRAAVAATSVNANAYTLQFKPTHPGGAPIVNISALGLFVIDNQVITAKAGEPKINVLEDVGSDHIKLRLTGQTPANVPVVAFKRRVALPLHHAGYALIDALRQQGIRCDNKVSIVRSPAKTTLLAGHGSVPLSQVLHHLGKDSDNFSAEMIIKVLAAQNDHKPGSTARGVSIARRVLERLGVRMVGARFMNGSGLYQGNMVSAEQLAMLLSAMYRRPQTRDDFVAHLAVGGVDGTLAKRFTQGPASKHVFAKTGTLNDTAALSGYVFDTKHERVLVFSFIANNIKGKVDTARRTIDDIVTRLAAWLNN